MGPKREEIIKGWGLTLYTLGVGPVMQPSVHEAEEMTCHYCQTSRGPHKDLSVMAQQGKDY